VSDLPDLDPTEPRIFDRIIEAAREARARRRRGIEAHEARRREERDEAIERMRLRDELIEQKNAVTERQKILDRLFPQPGEDGD
jgi:hypothetical protein